MSLYRCATCGCIENSAMARYWQRKMDARPLLCSACEPTISRWHGQFPRRSARGMLVDGQGHLWHPRSVMTMPTGATIIGIVQEPARGDIATDDPWKR